METLSIIGAREGNLRDVTLRIPKNRLVVFTGVSGSGKSTLLVDVLFNECQRLYLEALSLQGIRKPAVERVKGASPAIAILQNDANKNPRSTVGTLTDVYTALRMVYEKLGVYPCPRCGKTICAADCLEETERVGDDFHVYIHCSACGERVDKITRTDFSFNTREGACPACEGLGRVLAVDRAAAVNEGKSLEDGAVAFWAAKYKGYQIGVFRAACRHFGLPDPANVPVAAFGELQKALLYEGAEADALARALPHTEPPKKVADGRFEGVVPQLMRRAAEHGADGRNVRPYLVQAPCPECGGERLCARSRAVTVADTRLPELSGATLRGLSTWVSDLDAQLDGTRRTLVEDYLLDLSTKLARIAAVGLDYLTLDRATVTLSGGELQRLRLSAILDSELTGVVYILDEPTAGLHPRDTAGLVDILRRLRDLGNSVLVIEHDPDVMRAADHLVDLGPGAGACGGCVVAEGSLADLAAAPDSTTGRFLARKPALKRAVRTPDDPPIRIRNATRFNLRHLDVDIPAGRLVTVTGPSGSGKSTLVFEVLAHGNAAGPENAVAGCERFDRIASVGQSPLARMKRSNVATYIDTYGPIRSAFAGTDAARACGLAAKAFSFNTPGGRCETCEGMGTVANNLLFFLDTEVPCPACHGQRFHDDVLSVRLDGRSIVDVLALSVGEAAAAFADRPKIVRPLRLLQDVGLGYLQLGQSLTTLSGGEAQRLKLAKELLTAGRTRTLYLLDEPTSGLHPQDVEHFLALLDRLVDGGNTVVVVEHNQQVVCASDWVVDLGPEGGEAGGRVMFAGTPAALAAHGEGATADCLRKALDGQERVNPARIRP
ncbi:excinuclease ABC subunit UvrA [Gordonibacter massiliensis (ex Traore et al. 2017)]|uniref:UvrABC system protein A n=1 Tax=Gordonibacter massiliensis (ex Traore et al. 2017) TaxID=1841863 RepID=A0A842JI57_9ACTN|nr:excinuclease ABC subunit UvrA [Gordonibacter massiliensis (ex Traore et al. 2017)]MBC2890171.1 excinuclease ABC subunit UvrA [Gordonibacter massiliensis (ex Traore et al. 2017)]